MKNLITISLMCFCLCFSVSSYALRCGTKLVIEGDSEYRTLNICGEPDFQETYYTTEPLVYGGIIGPYASFGIGEQVKYDKWTYNFGSNQFLYILTFRNGVLFKIETNGYGF